jgi:hypothetical protein
VREYGRVDEFDEWALVDRGFPQGFVDKLR